MRSSSPGSLIPERTASAMNRCTQRANQEVSVPEHEQRECLQPNPATMAVVSCQLRAMRIGAIQAARCIGALCRDEISRDNQLVGSLKVVSLRGDSI